MVNEACLSMGRKPAQTWRRMEVLFTNISVLREASGCAVKLISSSTKVHPFKQYSTEVVNSIVLSEQKRLLAVLILLYRGTTTPPPQAHCQNTRSKPLSRSSHQRLWLYIARIAAQHNYFVFAIQSTISLSSDKDFLLDAGVFSDIQSHSLF
jgi:hypothetical protein